MPQIRISRILGGVLELCAIAQNAAAAPIPKVLDQNLQACINEIAAKNAWTTVEQFTRLLCANRGIVQLDGLQAFSKLQEIDLANNSVQALYALPVRAPISKLNLAGNRSLILNEINNQLPNFQLLKSLNLNGIRIGSIRALNSLRNPRTGAPWQFTELDLGNTDLLDEANGNSVEFLRRMPSLKKLNVAGNNINNISALAVLPQLADLDVSNNNLSGGFYLPQTTFTRLNFSGNRKLRIQEFATFTWNNSNLTSIGLNGINVGSFANLGPLRDSRTGQPLKLTELDLGNTNLTDANGNPSIAFLQQFPTLTKLNLAGNNLTEAQALGAMPQLSELDLSDNALSNIFGLAPLRNLTRLNLGGNLSLRGDDVYYSLLKTNPGLTSIGLSGINLSQMPSILNLTNPANGSPYNLQELDLSRTKIPFEALGALPRFSNLQRLNLASNRFAGFSMLPPFPASLQELDLSDNRIDTPPPMYLLQRLTRLNLSNTGMPAQFVAGVIAQNPNLTSLSLNGLALDEFPQMNPFRNPQSGKQLNLSELELANSLHVNIGTSWEWLRSMTSLKRLNLSGTGLTRVDQLSTLVNLQEIDFSNNQLQDLAPISQLRTLTRLNLAGNKNLLIQHMSFMLAQNTNLTSLNLNGINVGSFDNLARLTDMSTGQPLNLTELDLGNTALLDSMGGKNFSFLGVFSNLQKLNLAGNGMRDVNGLSNLKQLKDVDLSNNQIGELQPIFMLSNLKRLNLSGNSALALWQVRPLLDRSPNISSLGLNGIAILDGGNLGPWMNLESLDIGNTQLNAQGRTDAWFLGLFPNLQSLNIAGNGLVNLHGVEMLRWLREIDASNNQLQDVAVLGTFKDLQSVNLAGNNTLPGMMVTPIVGNNLNLVNLNLNGIQIGNLANLGLFMGGTNSRPALRSLDIANTGMQEMNGLNFLVMLPNLARLNVAGNKIDNLSGLYGRTTLRELDLSSNPLNEVGMLYQMNYLSWLNLSEDTNVLCWQLDGLQSNLPQTKVIRPTSCRM